MTARLAIAGVLMLLATLAAAQDTNTPAPDYDREAMAKVEALIDADPKLSGLYAQCPADVFGSERPFWGDSLKHIEREDCEADPARCFAGCVQALSGNACFELSHAMQHHEPDYKARYYEGLFTQACAVGHAAGCTNRGGGIRNGGYSDDPFRRVDADVREGCLLRTFDIACAADEAWGCAMLGQAHHRGEGVEANEEEALRYYRRSCAIEPDFDACRFAQDGIAAIEGFKDEDFETEQDL
jgi:hypothetical protein